MLLKVFRKTESHESPDFSITEACFCISTLSRFKNVMFDIKSGDEVGLFEVSAKFMGVAMEKVELVFQVIEYSFEQVKLKVKLTLCNICGDWRILFFVLPSDNMTIC